MYVCVEFLALDFNKQNVEIINFDEKNFRTKMSKKYANGKRRKMTTFCLSSFFF